MYHFITGWSLRYRLEPNLLKILYRYNNNYYGESISSDWMDVPKMKGEWDGYCSLTRRV